MHRYLSALVSAVLLSGSIAYAQPSITLDVRGAQLTDVVALLATQSHENIVLDSAVPQASVTLRLANVSVHEALSAIEGAYGLAEVHHARYLALVPVKSALGAGDAANNFTIHVDIPNGNATAIAQTLSGVLQHDAFVSAVDSRTLVLSGNAQAVTRGEKLAQQLGGGTDYAYDTVTVNHVSPSAIVANLTTMHVADGSPLYANDSNSTIVVGGSLGYRENVERVIHALDVPANVITFDMYVLDVQPMNDNSNRGILWGQVVPGQNGQITITPGSATATIGSGYKVPVGVQINELVSSGKAKLLASPQLVVPSGSSNDFKNGGTYPIAVANGALLGGQSVQYYPFGILVHIAATMGGNGDIVGSIKASDSDIAAFDPASHLPIISDRSDVVDGIPMHEGEPIIIAGMFSDTETDVLQKLPLLGDIPLLGSFFRNRQTTHQQDQLMFVIIPHKGKPRPSASLQQELRGVQ